MSLPSTSSSLVISAFPSSLACMIFLKVIQSVQFSLCPSSQPPASRMISRHISVLSEKRATPLSSSAYGMLPRLHRSSRPAIPRSMVSARPTRTSVASLLMRSAKHSVICLSKIDRGDSKALVWRRISSDHVLACRSMPRSYTSSPSSSFRRTRDRAGYPPRGRLDGRSGKSQGDGQTILLSLSISLSISLSNLHHPIRTSRGWPQTLQHACTAVWRSQGVRGGFPTQRHDPPM